MLKDKIYSILNMPSNYIRSKYGQLVESYFDRSISLFYLNMTICEENIIIKSSHISNEINLISGSDEMILFNLLQNSNDYILGSGKTIYEKMFKELWKIFYSEDTDVLIVPCYVTKTNIYLACINDFITLKNDYNMIGLNAENTIIDEFPVLYFTLKHCLYDYYFEYRDIAWESIIGCGNMIQSVKIINNIFQYYYIPGLELFQELSNMPYEGANNFGIIDFVDKIQEQIYGYTIEFMDKCVLYKNQGRVLRKYLQMSGENRHLLASRFNAYDQVNQCWVIGGIGTDYDKEILCSVKFLGNSKWSCEFKNEIVLYNGTEYEVQIKNRAKNSNKYENDIKEIFGEVLSQNIFDVINKVKAQSHGTMLVISDDAKAEAERLGKIHRAIRTRELNMQNQTLESMLALTSIDGAIMMDIDCICYSIGTILDGSATIYSNLGRGSRYNSAYTYIHNMQKNKKKCAAVVISEDGMVDIITTVNIKFSDNDLYRNIKYSDYEIMIHEIIKNEEELDFDENGYCRNEEYY
jgi:hypothetical protein